MSAGGRRFGDGEGEDLPELPVPEAPAPPGGATLAGMLGERYQTIARLGAGAFGEVYHAHDRVLGREVAIKRIRLENLVEPAQLEEVKRRFLREAQVAARLRHPNIVTTHDIVSSEVTSFIVMELVEGRTLQSLIEERGRLPVAETLAILGQVASALDHAHRFRVIHRDVKPANIMVEPSGHVKVMDFGIAKAEAGGNLTASGLIVGTPNYMSPEQARGEAVDARSDLFSLGCVLYECLTGRKPFAAETVTAILLRIVTEDPPPVDHAAGLPRAVDEVLRRAVAKEPSARFASAREMLEAVEAATGSGAVPQPTAAPAGPSSTHDGHTVVARAPLRAPRPRGWPLPPARMRRPLVIGAAALIAIGTLAWLTLGHRGPRPRASALVVEQRPGLIGRMLGRTSTLQITVPEGTSLRLSVQTALSSETAAGGDSVSAETTSAVRIEGVVALPRGSLVAGRVSRAASAEQAGGRGELALEFDSVTLPDGSRYELRTRPLAMRASAEPRRKDEPITLAGIGSMLGGLLNGHRSGVSGGSARTVSVTKEKGREVTLPLNAALTVETARATTVTRPAAGP